LIKPKALLLDLDGTLVDSRDDIATALNAALSVHGVAPLAFPRVYGMIGDGARMLVTRALAAAESSVSIDAVLATLNAQYSQHPCVQTKLLDGAREIFACGIPCAIITNKPRAVTVPLLAALDLAPAALWAADGPLKPAPDSVLATCEALDVAPRDAWMIGDGPQDIGAGKAAGAFTVAVLGNIADHEAVRAAKPDLVVGSLRELISSVAALPL
jgi:HAD superfamily hydrolase (TIGR01509 family)